jgi:hypothetical protein
LPAYVSTAGGRLSIEDLLPTLAGGFEQMMTPPALPVRAGALDGAELVQEPLIAKAWAGASNEQIAKLAELFRLHLWSIKPVFDFAPHG